METIRVGAVVRCVRVGNTTKKPHLLFEGVVVDIDTRILWGFDIKVQVVTPTPLYDRGEIIETTKSALEVIDKVTIQ